MSPDPDVDLEARLRAALQPTAPSREWSQQLLERLAAGAKPAAVPAVMPARESLSPRSRTPVRRTGLWLPVGLAASVLLIAGLWGLQSYEHREQGLAARRQVIEALRVTNQKLDLAYRVVHDESRT